jgi:hypothetical protein
MKAMMIDWKQIGRNNLPVKQTAVELAGIRAIICLGFNRRLDT